MDALPYIDREYNDVKDEVDLLIKEEMGLFQPRDYLAHLEPMPDKLFKDDALLAAEQERVRTKKPLRVIDSERYGLVIPEDDTTEEDLQELIKRLQISIHYQSVREANLNLANQYGPNSWLSYANRLDSRSQALAGELEQIKNEISSINQQRQRSQTSVEVQLRQLEAEWLSLTEKNFHIQQACINLEHQKNALEAMLANGTDSNSHA
eukprot:TRINITY_DN3130_c0_g1_i1.p1 TRINITY_DN3130_c0_g1~~TRINITY_DN3130_c0_g1_i1.p1  ORF type:complete len:215 (+),score=89.34 TRINITY_DN3130_c0_g1_i1:23-646(+)